MWPLSRYQFLRALVFSSVKLKSCSHNPSLIEEEWDSITTRRRWHRLGAYIRA
jgi:hypothetical protein